MKTGIGSESFSPQDADAYINLSDMYVKLKRYEEAVACSQKAMKLAPHAKEAVLNYSVAEFCLGNNEQTIRALEKFLPQASDYPLALGLLSVAYLVQGEREKSIPLLDRIKRMGFDYGEYLRNSAKELVSLGRSEQAQKLMSLLPEAFPQPLSQ